MKYENTYKVLRKKGFFLTCEVLIPHESGMIEREFFTEFKNCGNHLNDFYRLRDLMLEYEVIEIFLNEDYRKAIRMTEKGRQVWELLSKIEELVIE